MGKKECLAFFGDFERSLFTHFVTKVKDEKGEEKK